VRHRGVKTDKEVLTEEDRKANAEAEKAIAQGKTKPLFETTEPRKP
jgi:hypothetical protein